MTSKEYALINAADYSSTASLRKLYKGLNKLKILAESGNTTAQCIVIDLMDGLAQLRGDQKEYVQDVLIDGFAVLSTFFRKFINLIHGKISRELYPHHIHKDASYPCIFYNPIES